MEAFEGIVSPSELVAMFATKGLRISERELRRKARELGCCRELGKALFFLPEDIGALFEGLKVPKPNATKTHRTGRSSDAASTEDVLRLLDAKSRKRKWES